MTAASSTPHRIHLKELLIFCSVYLFFAWLYYTTLWFNRGGFDAKDDSYMSISGFLNWGGIDYALKLILSLPIWWLIFRRMYNFPLYQRLLTHLITLPLFVVTWQKLYYWVIEQLGMFHLTGSSQVWDIYIPGLFYMLLFGVIHAYAYFKQTQENLKLEAQLREAALKSELSALKAQLNPHFLYNVFNTINASVPPEMENTRQMIAELSDLFRYQLRASKSELVPLRDELAFTCKYLDLEKSRFEDRLTVEVNTDDGVLDVMVPPMILQPMVENAVKHGISPLIDGGKIAISIKKQGDKLLFDITDTGIGAKQKDELLGKGVGLTNTELRLNKMYGTSLIFSDNLPQGLNIQFMIG
jgi:sensor histidine kinase YesM